MKCNEECNDSVSYSTIGSVLLVSYLLQSASISFCLILKTTVWISMFLIGSIDTFLPMNIIWKFNSYIFSSLLTVLLAKVFLSKLGGLQVHSSHYLMVTIL